MADRQTVPPEPITAADGTPLKKKLAQALFRSRVRAASLVLQRDARVAQPSKPSPPCTP